MDRSQIAGIVLTLLILAALAWRLHGPGDEPAQRAGMSATAPTATPRHSAPGTPTPTTAAVAQRLAGVAIGTTRYAVVEQPDGSTALYRSGDEVPGLGKIVEISEGSATFEGADGRVSLRVKPPPTATFRPTQPPKKEDEEDATAAPEPTGSPPPARSATVSPPSTVRGRPAS